MRKLFLFLTLLLITACCPSLNGPLNEGNTGWEYKETDLSQRVVDCHGKTMHGMTVRRSNTLVKNCIIDRDLRVFATYRNANHKDLVAMSKDPSYVEKVRRKGLDKIVIKDTTIRGNGQRVPLYIGPGTHNVLIDNVKVIGKSPSTMVYLGAETTMITITNSLIDATNAEREAIAIDASSHNTIKNNTIKFSKGGIFLYRNCGEGGVARHTTPSYNKILGNTFEGEGIAVWLSARDGNRCYCQDDAKGKYGSSVSDLDFARFNTVQNNKLNKGIIKQGSSASENKIQ